MPGKLSGTIHLSLSNSTSDTLKTSSLTQDFSTNWSTPFGPYITLRAGLRYHDLGINQGINQDFWQRQVQPSGEFVWNHPKFVLSSSIRRVESSNDNGSIDLLRENLGINFKSRLAGLPILNVRYEGNSAKNNNSRSIRDTRDNRLQAGLKYDFKNSNFHYNLTASNSKNMATDLKVADLNHIFRWGHIIRGASNKLQVTTSYSFNHRSQKTERPSGSEILQPISFFHALYNYDITALTDPLNVVGGLSDGNIDIAVQPEIDIGGNSLDQNIGVDFGYIRDVEGLYIYTDRQSDLNLNWQIFISNDNFTWEPIESTPSIVYNINFTRYDIFFDQQNTRYIKAVNTNFNDVSTVLITEIEAISSVENIDNQTRRISSHIIDLSSRYIFSNKLTSTFDFAMRKTPVSDFSNSPEQIYYSLSTKHSISDNLTQNFSFQAGYDRFSQISSKNKNVSVSYNLLFDPLETLDFSLSASTRTSYINELKDHENNNLLLHSNGSLFDGLNLVAEIGYNKYNRFGGLPGLTTWSYRISGDAWLTRWLSSTFSHRYQMTEPVSSTARRTRRQYGVDYNLRFTGSIFLRGKYALNKDENLRNTLQEYSISWNMSSRLTGGATFYKNDNNKGTGSDRYTARINYKVSSRSTIFASYSDTEFTQAGRRRTSSFQAGLRTGF